MPAKTAKRSYNSSRRTLQAAQTRDEVLRAGSELFRETGWTGTTLAAIAERAGVSVETVYKSFGVKAGLVRALYERGLAGRGPRPAPDRSDAMSARGEAPADSVWSSERAGSGVAAA